MRDGGKCKSCCVCEKSFTRAGHFKRHRRIHLGIEPHQWYLCEMTFSTKGTYNLHKKTHTIEKSFGCPVCKVSVGITCDSCSRKVDFDVQKSDESQGSSTWGLELDCNKFYATQIPGNQYETTKCIRSYIMRYLQMGHSRVKRKCDKVRDLCTKCNNYDYQVQCNLTFPTFSIRLRLVRRGVYTPPGEEDPSVMLWTC